MIRIEGEWVVFNGEDARKFEPKQEGDEFRVNTQTEENPNWTHWRKYDTDLRNGHLEFSSSIHSEDRRPIALCKPHLLPSALDQNFSPF